MHLLSYADAGLLSLGCGDGANVFSLRTSLSDSLALRATTDYSGVCEIVVCARHRRHRPIYRTQALSNQLKYLSCAALLRTENV
jgi:hypothetical protein